MCVQVCASEQRGGGGGGGEDVKGGESVRSCEKGHIREEVS